LLRSIIFIVKLIIILHHSYCKADIDIIIVIIVKLTY